jgi:hypothetical protein
LQKALLDNPDPAIPAAQRPRLIIACSDDPVYRFRAGPVYYRPPGEPDTSSWIVRASLLNGYSLLLSPPQPVTLEHLGFSLEELDNSLQLVSESQSSKRAAQISGELYWPNPPLSWREEVTGLGIMGAIVAHRAIRLLSENTTLDDQWVCFNTRNLRAERVARLARPVT